MTDPGPSLPDIDGERCVHAMAPFASCRSCVEACPAQAWVLDEDGLSLATDSCTGCGQCVPACPREALQMVRPITVLSPAKGRSVAFAACQQSAVRGSALACLHAIGVKDLDRMADEGVTSLTVASGACSNCALAPRGPTLWDAASRHALLRQSRQQSAIAVHRLEPAAYDRALARAREDADPVDRGRRRLFSPFIDRAPPAPADAMPAAGEPLAAFRPDIDSARCVACDACLRACPDGALRHGTTERGPAYEIVPLSCTGCRLCIDVCDQQAVILERDGPANVRRIGLDPYRCKACGVRYHAISGASAPEAGGLCRICSRTGHYKKLYQVIRDP